MPVLWLFRFHPAIILQIIFSSCVQLSNAKQYYYANYGKEDMTKLKPEFPNQSSWKLETMDRSGAVWQSCGSEVKLSGDQDWLLTNWFTPVSHEYVTLHFQISYLYWCKDESDDSKCSSDPLRMIILTETEQKEVNMTLSEANYRTPSNPFRSNSPIRFPEITSSGKFRIGINSAKFCVQIASLQIYNHYCPEVTNLLAKFPATFVPEKAAPEKTVYGECVQYSGLPSELKFGSSQTCSSYWGNWIALAPPDPICQCVSGYQPNKDKTNCTACKTGTFKEGSSNEACQQCPENSQSYREAASSCQCLPEFYRNPDEPASLPCGYTPSQPRFLKYDLKGENVILSWMAPQEDGLRAKTSYKIVCGFGCRYQEPLVTNSTQISVPIQPGTLYRYKVFSLNSLSGFYKLSALSYDVVEFQTPKRYVVKMLKATEVTVGQVRLEWERPKGYMGTKYCVKMARKLWGSPDFTYDIACSNHSATQFPEVIYSDLQYGSYGFSVRTEVQGVPGPYSEEVPIEIQQSSLQIGFRHVGFIVAIMITIFVLFIILCIGLALLYRRRGPMYKYEHSAGTLPPGVLPAQLLDVASANGAPVPLGYKLPVGQLFTEPSFFDDTDQILAELTCELDEQYLQLSSEVTPHDQGAVCQGSLFNPSSHEYTKSKVKALYLNMATPEGARKFAIESALMAQFQHVNITAFYGVVYTPSMWMLVSEASEKGPLYRILQESAAAGTLDLATQLSYLRGIVGGMHYLADFGYIHKVLTSGNIVINERDIPKISGFDMRALLDESPTNTKSFVELMEYLAPWQAPEVAQPGGAAKYSSCSDVWSFAVVAWEVMSHGQEPYGSMNSQQILEYIVSGKRLAPPKDCPQGLYKMMCECWRDNRNHRPWFVQIYEVIANSIRSHCFGEFPPPGTKQPALIGKLTDNGSDYYMTLQKAQTMDPLAASSANPTDTLLGGSVMSKPSPSSPVHIRDWLKEMQLSQYAEKLEQSGYTELHDIFDMQDSSLKSLGISSAKHRKKLLANIALAKIRERKQLHPSLPLQPTTLI